MDEIFWILRLLLHCVLSCAVSCNRPCLCYLVFATNAMHIGEHC